MKILITGAQGQLGTRLCMDLKAQMSLLGSIPNSLRDAEVIGIDIQDLDLTDHGAVQQYIQKIQPDIVIHCAAMTNVDACETQQEMAMAVNADATVNLANACQKVNAKLVCVSTDYVFDGQADMPYEEDAPTLPRTQYGLSKLRGEIGARQECDRLFIVRVAWLYGLYGSNFVKTILKLAADRDQIKVVNDQTGSPTNAADVSHCLLLLAAGEKYGTYHVTNKGQCTWYDFACEIVRLSTLKCKVVPCSTQEFPRPAPRPKYSVLSHQNIQAAIGDPTREWKTALADYMERLKLIK